MQRLQRASNVEAAAEAILAGVPPVLWFWRQQMCSRRDRGLSVEQFRVLTLLGREPSASLTDVATFTGSSLPAASRLVARLADKGYVSRDADGDDRRRCTLSLTDRGRRAWEVAQAGTREAIAAELKVALSDHQCARVADAMRLLDGVFTAARLRGAASPAPPPPARKPRKSVAAR